MRPVGWLAVLVLLMLIGHILLQTSRDPKQELLDLESHWLSVEDDPVALEAILAPDFLHVVPAGIITKDEQLGFMRSHPAPTQSPEKHFEDMHVRIYGEIGIVNGMVVEVGSGTTRKTLFTDVFAYRDGKWQAVNAQELPDTERTTFHVRRLIGPQDHQRTLPIPKASCG